MEAREGTRVPSQSSAVQMGGRRSLCPLCFSQRSNSWGLSVTLSGTSCQSPLVSPMLSPSSYNSSWTVVLPQLGGSICPKLLRRRALPPSRVNEDFLWEMGHKKLTQSHKSVWVSATEMSAETEHATLHQYVSVGKTCPYSSIPTLLPLIWGLHCKPDNRNNFS